MRFFITGTAGFIGFHLARRLLDLGHRVTGFDGMTAYYDLNLKRARLKHLTEREGYTHFTAMLEDMPGLEAAAASAEPDIIIHLAAQAGVRYSLENPRAYVDANLVGSFNLLEVARQLAPKHLMLASTSSVYGANAKVPFVETDRADEPMTLYAATKKSMEAMAHSYAHLWKIPTTVFRFFTVYGPYGRPDMAPLKFITAIDEGRPIEVYGEGRMSRDFTYIDDLVAAIAALVDIVPDEANRVRLHDVHDTLSPVAPFRVVNLGGGQPIGLMAFIAAIETALGKQAQKIFLPMQKGDVPQTFASAELLRALTGQVPDTPLAEGVTALVSWYRDYTDTVSS